MSRVFRNLIARTDDSREVADRTRTTSPLATPRYVTREPSTEPISPLSPDSSRNQVYRVPQPRVYDVPPPQRPADPAKTDKPATPIDTLYIKQSVANKEEDQMYMGGSVASIALILLKLL